MGSSRREEGTAQLGLPSMFKGEGGDAEVLEEGIKGGEEERDSSDLPQDRECSLGLPFPRIAKLTFVEHA